ncbi:MAG TPA: nucleotidyltransferase family protein [Rhodopila sp.]|uniref:nucleotidyltransferase family protein n=1 Tax=Rhodopila sp. TaxID=2480087 RepID=UPI002CBAA512|nr:nucleotidyltransferase family protein [Rhodopila sp.]HVY16919.1 nucleotidyltransferase family protein [Rhodopila sp.]
MTVSPRSAMVLAAGFGTRMRPLTETTAKPLLKLGGKTLLDHALDHLAEAGVETAAVNTFWQADAVAEHLRRRTAPPRTVLLREDVLLETGGGVRAALPVLGDDPFFVVNGDAFWLNGPIPALLRLADAFDPSVDAVLLLQRTSHVHADVGLGDFALDKWGVPRRRRQREVVPYIYAGVQLIRPELLEDLPEGPFSMNLAWDAALAKGRVRAVVHDGIWFHLSTPQDLAEAELILPAQVTGDARWPWR